jgi:hypothetical protein
MKSWVRSESGHTLKPSSSNMRTVARPRTPAAPVTIAVIISGSYSRMKRAIGEARVGRRSVGLRLPAKELSDATHVRGIARRGGRTQSCLPIGARQQPNAVLYSHARRHLLGNEFGACCGKWRGTSTE